MMKILICDDDELFSEDLEKKLEQYEINHRDEFDIHVVNHGEEALTKLKEEQWDVLFLDIEMPNINGVEVGTRVREQLQNYGLKIIYVADNQRKRLLLSIFDLSINYSFPLLISVLVLYACKGIDICLFPGS